MKPKPIHVCCNEDLGNGHGGGEWDEEKIGDDGEVLKVGRLDGLGCLLLGGSNHHRYLYYFSRDSKPRVVFFTYTGH